MLIKTSNAVDYSGVQSPLLTPRPAVEFLQTIVLSEYHSSTGAGATLPTGSSVFGASVIAVDAPSWANFKRYKRIQFSIGSFGASASDTLMLNTRRNFLTYSATKYFTREAITATTTITYTNTSSTTSVELAATVTASTGAVRQLDVYLSQMGGNVETFQGDTGAALITGNINRTNFTMVNPGNASLPGFAETDIPGIQLFFSGGNVFRPMRFGSATQTSDYTLECNIYGWLR